MIVFIQVPSIVIFLVSPLPANITELSGIILKASRNYYTNKQSHTNIGKSQTAYPVYFPYYILVYNLALKYR